MRRQLQSLGQHFLKFDAAIFELYRVHGRELPTEPDRYSHCNPGYFTNLAYQSELREDPQILYRPLLDLWRRVNSSNQELRLKIQQMDHQIGYLEGKKNRLLEEDLGAD